MYIYIYKPTHTHHSRYYNITLCPNDTISLYPSHLRPVYHVVFFKYMIQKNDLNSEHGAQRLWGFSSSRKPNSVGKTPITMFTYWCER